MPTFDQTPDQPEAFGYKVSWFALKTSDPRAVLAALELGEATQANWSSGLAAAYGRAPRDDQWVFVSPPIGGWVLAISQAWPYPNVETRSDLGARFDVLLSRLMKQFDDVQFFGSHRVADFAAWARALNGEPKRIFAYGGGEVLINFGDQTLEEAKLGLVNLTGLSPRDAGDAIFKVAEAQGDEEEGLVASGLSYAEALAKVHENGRQPFPEEEDVVDLAALWSIDPTQLEDQDYPPGLGLVARLPEDLRQ